jgi:HlyD family secretion protein
VQGEVDATRFDIAARVDGRVGEIPVERGQNVAAGAVLVKIDNPETIAKNEQALAAKIVAEAQLANIKVGTRAEVIAAKKAALERAQASVVLAPKDLRPHQPAGRARQCPDCPARSGDRFPARKPARGRSGQISLRAGRQRLHERGA